MKKISKFILFTTLVLVTYASFVINVNATTNYVHLGGDSIGLKIDTGVIVTGKFVVENTYKPWKNSVIDVGDKIIEFDNQKINNNQDLLYQLLKSNSDSAVLTIERNNKIFDTSIEIIKTQNHEKSLGLYVKDQVLGVGTLTFTEPNTRYYASLGHKISEKSLENNIINGTLVDCSIENIKKATTLTPGEKRGIIDNKKIGTILYNNESGVYGKMLRNPQDRKKINISDDIKCGKAKMYTVIEDNKVECFDILITSTKSTTKNGIKAVKIKVVDDLLISKCGGIVQGMSGSPVVQDNKLVGAISHVTLDNPQIGYAIYAKQMYDDVLKLA